MANIAAVRTSASTGPYPEEKLGARLTRLMKAVAFLFTTQQGILTIGKQLLAFPSILHTEGRRFFQAKAPACGYTIHNWKNGEPLDNPLLFVHGMNGFAGQFDPLLEGLKARNINRPIIVISLENNKLTSVQQDAMKVHAICKEIFEGKQPPVQITAIGHSKGGLVVHYLKEHSKSLYPYQIGKAISIASPHGGAPVADFVGGHPSRDFGSQGEIVEKQQGILNHADYYYIGNTFDHLVPTDSSLPPSVPNERKRQIYDPLRAHSILSSPTVADQVAIWLRSEDHEAVRALLNKAENEGLISSYRKYLAGWVYDPNLALDVDPNAAKSALDRLKGLAVKADAYAKMLEGLNRGPDRVKITAQEAREAARGARELSASLSMAITKEARLAQEAIEYTIIHLNGCQVDERRGRLAIGEQVLTDYRNLKDRVPSEEIGFTGEATNIISYLSGAAEHIEKKLNMLRQAKQCLPHLITHDTTQLEAEAEATANKAEDLIERLTHAVKTAKPKRLAPAAEVEVS